MPLLRFPVGEKACGRSKAFHSFLDLFQADSEKFLAHVRSVHAAACELFVKCAFEGWGFIRIDHRMGIKAEGDACVTKLFNPVVWFKPPRQADLYYILTKGTNVRDNVDIARFGHLCHCAGAFTCRVGFG